MNVTEGRGPAPGSSARESERLRCEAVVPVAAHRRATSLIGLSLMLVLVASGVDALVWTYQSQRQLWRDEAGETTRPAAAWREVGYRRVRSTPIERSTEPARTPAEGEAPVAGRVCAFPHPVH
jgi:hypothetical protein